MPGYSETIRCPKCGENSMTSDTWISTGEVDEFCHKCGNCREIIRGLRLSDEELDKDIYT